MSKVDPRMKKNEYEDYLRQGQTLLVRMLPALKEYEGNEKALFAVLSLCHQACIKERPELAKTWVEMLPFARETIEDKRLN